MPASCPHFENRDPLKGDGNITGKPRPAHFGRHQDLTKTLKTETRLKGMETFITGFETSAVRYDFENRDPLKGDGNYDDSLMGIVMGPPHL
jgi:hypothetical protein